MELIRAMLISGGTAVFVWWVLTLRQTRPDIPRLPREQPYFCRAHSKPEDLCRDMHDPEEPT